MPAHDLVLHSGRVVTLDQSSHIAEALALRDGRIVAVGSSAEVSRDEGPATRSVDLAGRTVVPGFFDAHAHMDREGLKARGGIRLQGLNSVAAILEAVREAAAHTPPGEWIVTMPMERARENHLDRFVSHPEEIVERRFPTRHDLDVVAPDHPVYVRSVWGWWSRPPFPSVVNSRALEIAGITRDTPAPYRTEIVKDETGEPTGVLIEQNRAPILEYTLLNCVPRFTYEDRVAAVRMGAALYSAAGTTSVYEGHGLTPNLIHAYRRINEDGDLTVRLHTTLSVPTAMLSDSRIEDHFAQWAELIGGRGSGDDAFRCEGLTLDLGDPEIAKIVARAYPYEQWSGHFYQSIPHERLVEIGTIAARLGIRIACLVCYELEAVLRAYEEIDRRVPIRDKRWIIVHLISATDEQFRRIKELGLVVTVTPNFMYEAGTRFGLAELGDQGTPIADLLDRDIPVALSSDNVPVSMLWAMWEALARWDDDSKSRLGPSHLSREQALRLICESGHRIGRNEDRLGTLEVGKMADLVVLDGDPLSCEEDAIKDIPVLQTYLGGRKVHDTAGEASGRPA